MKLRTALITVVVLTIALFSATPLLLAYGWNHGVVGAVDGVHRISYGTALLVEMVIGALGAASALPAAMPKAFLFLYRLPEAPPFDPQAFATAAALARYAEQTNASAEMPQTEPVPAQEPPA